MKAVILSIDQEKRRISLGLKPSYFEEKDFEQEDSEDEEEDELRSSPALGVVEDEDEEDEEEGEEAIEDDDDEMAAGIHSDEDEESDEEAGGMDLDLSLDLQKPSGSSSIASTSGPKDPLRFDGGFQWTAPDGSADVEMASDDDSDEDADSPFGQLRHWVKENRDAGAVEIYKKAEDLGIAKKHQALVVLGEALFTENVVAEIPKYAPLFVKVCPLVAVCQSFLLSVVIRRWSPRRSTRSRSWAVLSASSASPTQTSPRLSRRSSWRSTRWTYSTRKSSSSGAPTSARSTSTVTSVRRSERPASPS